MRSSRNHTLALTASEIQLYRSRLHVIHHPVALEAVLNRTFNQDTSSVLELLPREFVDLLILDPPYNLDKSFGATTFTARSAQDYEDWMESWLAPLLPTLKSTASVYVCGDWRSSTAIHRVLSRHLIVRNRITWERDKGRGATTNWKNCSEDIWFSTVSSNYTFNVDSVKHGRVVIAPYTDTHGNPKDWYRTPAGNFRLTHPSNIWTDITVPFWSMQENTDHPTQKPEKLVAKLILASSNPGDLVFDPFLGSGTTSVVAKKLGRHWLGVEIDEVYCCLAEKRLDMAERDRRIQGFQNGVFWPRNTHLATPVPRANDGMGETQGSLDVMRDPEARPR